MKQWSTGILEHWENGIQKQNRGKKAVQLINVWPALQCRFMKIMYKLPLFIIAVILICTSASAGKNDTLVLLKRDDWAKVKSLVGKAEVRSSSADKWRPVYVGMKLKMEWDLRTHLESSLELSFPSGTIVKLGENGIISLSTLFNDKNSNNSNIEITSENDSVSVITITDENEEKQYN